MASIEIWVDKDTYVRSDAVDYDFSSDPFTWIHSGNWNARTFIEFDISEGPTVATDVYLQLFMRGGDSHLGPRIIDFKRLIELIPDPVTWDKQPSATDINKHSEALPAADEYGWFSFDITELYNDAKAAGDTLGILLKYQTESLADDYGRLIKTKESDGTLSASILVNYEVEEPTAPTISSLTWSPTGDYTILASGASLPGTSENLRLIEVTDKAALQIDDGPVMYKQEGDSFQFDGKYWWILNTVCGPECDFITIADENAEAARIPKVGDVVQFIANIDWHGQEIGSIHWHYGKPPNVCFQEEDIDWTLFATNTAMPEYLFENEEDTGIVFLRVTATNKAGDVGVFGNLCRPAFNLWGDDADVPGLLEIQFNSGSVYKYRNIEKFRFEEFMNAPSKGKYFWQHIRQETVKYPYERVR